MQFPIFLGPLLTANSPSLNPSGLSFMMVCHQQDSTNDFLKLCQTEIHNLIVLDILFGYFSFNSGQCSTFERIPVTISDTFHSRKWFAVPGVTDAINVDTYILGTIIN